MRSPLLHRLFDYAGVFPPAALSVADARREYLETVDGEHGWVVGPMLVLTSQLEQLVAAGGAPTQLGLVADEVPPAGLTLTQVERRTDAAHAAAAIDELRDHAPVLYVESSDPSDLGLLETIATARAVGVDVRAKIRTGGATADAFPSPRAVAAFLAECARLQLPFKATAGLHHPVRTPSHVPQATEHGFVNLLAAVRCTLAGDEQATLAALESTDLSDFDVTTATFRGVGGDVAPEAVRAVFRSIGSCSVEEPARYLIDLGML